MFFGVVKARPFKLLEDHPLPKFELELLNLGFSSNGFGYSGAFFKYHFEKEILEQNQSYLL